MKLIWLLRKQIQVLLCYISGKVAAQIDSLLQYFVVLNSTDQITRLYSFNSSTLNTKVGGALLVFLRFDLDINSAKVFASKTT